MEWVSNGYQRVLSYYTRDYNKLNFFPFLYQGLYTRIHIISGNTKISFKTNIDSSTVHKLYN